MHPHHIVRKLILVGLGFAVMALGLVFILSSPLTPTDNPPMYQETDNGPMPPQANYFDDTSSLDAEVQAAGDEINSNNSTDFNLEGIE